MEQQPRFAEPPAMQGASAPNATVMSDSLKAEYNKMFISGEYSDLAVKLSDGKIVRVHKVIVCRGSEFIRHAVSTISESDGTNVVEMLDDPPIAVRAMLQYLYINDYDNCRDMSEAQRCLCHLQIFLISHKRNMPSLQCISKERFRKSMISEGLDLAAVIPKAVDMAYHKDTSAHIWVRGLLTDKYVEDLQDLTQSDDLLNLLASSDVFAFDVAKSAAQQQQKLQTEALRKIGQELEDTRAALDRSETSRRQLEGSLNDTKALLRETSDKLEWRDAELFQIRAQIQVDSKNPAFRCPNSNCKKTHVPQDFNKGLQCVHCYRQYEVWKWFL